MRNVAPLAVLLAGLTGCLSPRTDTSRYFTLPPSSTPAAGGAAVPVLGLGPVTLPPYLERAEVATRVSPEQVTYSGTDRWAGPLDDLVARALAEDLRARLPAADVVRWPWPVQPGPDVAVMVDFLRLEADAGGGATLHARWTVTVRGSVPRPGESRIHEPSRAGDAGAAAAALARALDGLAGELAAAGRPP